VYSFINFQFIEILKDAIFDTKPLELFPSCQNV